MGNLTNKIITKGAVVALALSAVGATTANAAVVRTAGADRYSTANEIFKAWPTTTDTAVLAAGMGHDVDALTVAPLAKAKNAPVILVDTKASVASIVAQFSSFKNIYIANGTGVITPAVEAALTAAGKTVTRLGGANRTETALNIAKALGAANNIVVANGDDAHLVDTLSIASIAAAKGMPIFLTSGGSLDSAELAYAKGLGATNVYALGGTSVVSDAAVAGLGNATRLAGAGRYETNAAVVNAFKADLDLSNVYVASGEDANLIDALAGAPLAGLKKAPIVFAHNDLNADVNTLLKGVINANTNINVLGGTGAVADSAFNAIKNIQVPGSGNPSNGTLSVSSVSAISANSMKIVFNQAPTDTSKINFAVKGSSGTAVTTTTAWNSAMTEATVSTSYSLAPDTYSVNVKQNTADLGTNNVTITQQAVSKITITSTILSVVPMNGSPTQGEGFATYRVIDQYGTDITSTPLGNNIQWNCGIGTIDSTYTKDGVIAIEPVGGVGVGTPLAQYTTTGATINGYDSDNYIAANATLTVSQSAGTLSDIKLNKLTSPNNDDFNAGNTTGQWYIDYTALDASGNATTDVNLVQSGIMTTNGGAYLTVTPGVDPNDNKKAALAVSIIPSAAANLSSDIQIPINVLTTSGKSSTLTVTLKKATSVSSITLSAPTEMVASGETVNIPFTALDQNGSPVTKYSDLVVGGVSKVNLTISGGGTATVGFVRNPDGTASVQATMPTLQAATGSLTAYINSNVIATGKSNQLTLNVQQPKKPDSLAIDTTAKPKFFQAGATQKLDFGLNDLAFTLNDQYGRAMDITNEDQSVTGTYYYVKPIVSGGGTSIVPTGTAYGNNEITLTASGTPGTTVINYVVYKNVLGVDSATSISKSVSYTVLKDSDINSYELETVPNKIKTVTLSATDKTLDDYAADPTLWGKTSGGGRVVLNPATIMGVSVDSSDFSLSSSAQKVVATSSASTDIHVYANPFALDPTKTGSSTTLTVTVKDSDSNYQAITTPITSTTTDASVSSIGFSASNETGTTGLSITGNTVTVDTSMTAIAALTGSATDTLTKFNILNTKSAAPIYFYANDQYGTKDAAISNIAISSKSTAFAGILVKGTAAAGFYLDTATVGVVTSGDYFVLTATSANGKISTIKVVVK